MPGSLPGAQKRAVASTEAQAKISAPLRIARLLLPLTCLLCALPAFCQDSGSEENESRGSGAEIMVNVHDSSGDPISVAAMVKLYRRGSVPSRQAETSRGSALLVVNNLGDFTIAVDAAGYESSQKEVSIQANGRTQVDVYLRRSSTTVNAVAVAGRPLLAPKARKAVDLGLQALSADQIEAAEKYIAAAAHLAPSHPDVLYAQGVLLLKQRNWAKAQDALEKATQFDPSHAQALAALGMALCDQGKYDAAIAPLEKSLRLNPSSSWDTRWTLAKAYYQRQQYERALEMSQQARSQSKGVAPQIDLLVAQSLTAVARYEDAAQVLRQFLRDHAERPEAATARRWLQGLASSGKIRANQN